MFEPALSTCTGIRGLEQSDRYQSVPAKLPSYMTAIQFEVVMVVCASFVAGLLELLEDDELAHGVLPERAAAVLALGQKLAPVRQRMVGLAVKVVVVDGIEDLSRLQDATFDPAAKDGFPVSVRDERRAVRTLVPVARHQRQSPYGLPPGAGATPALLARRVESDCLIPYIDCNGGNRCCY